MKTVSVIVPTYKRNDYIVRALESIISQDYPAIEIIVVDDNGIDTPDQLATQKKLADYIAASKITYVCNDKNVGGALARNRGIKESTGEYITFLDDDDVYLPGKISLQVQKIEAENLDLCVMDGETYNERGECLSHKTQPVEPGMSQEELLKAHITKHITGTNVFMYKREALLKTGLFDQIPAGQEYMLMQKSILAALKIGCIHKVYVHFHMDGQERISTRLSKVEGLRIVYEAKKQYFSLLNRDEIASVKAKYHGTLFYMYFINKKYCKACLELLFAVASSPKYALESYKERKGKLKNR